MRDIVVRKRALDQDFVCSTFFVPEGNYRFTLEGCNEYAEGIIRNAKGDVVAILKPGESVDIARRGKYLICIQGRNAVGTIWTEWIVPPATDSKEYCCDELRATDEVLRTQIEGVKDKIKNIQEVVVEAGVNVTVTREGNTYTVNAVDTIPDVDKAYVDAKIAAIEDKDTITTVKAGANVTVTQSGNEYTVSATDTKPDVDKAYVDQKIAAIVDKDTITTVSAGDNVTVTQSGNDYKISAVDTIPDVDKAYVDQVVADNRISVWPGTNVNVGRVGNRYEISAVDTITTVKAGANVTVTQSGNDYTVNAADTITTVKAGANVTISQSGNEYTVNTDVNKAYVDDKIANIQDENTITTVSAGKNIDVTKSGDDYEVKTLDDVEFNKVKLSVSTNSVSAENLIQPGGYSLKITTNGTARTTAITNIGSHNINLSFKEELGTGANTYLLHDDKIEILPTYIRFTVDGEEAPAGGSILGLGNKTFDPANITSGRAATEDQLVALKNSIESNLSDNDTFHFTETSQGGIYRSKNFVDTQVYQNSMSLAQYDKTRNYGKSSIYLSEIDPTTRYYKFVEDYVIGSKQIVVSLEDIGFPSNDITVENILKYPIRWGGSFHNPTNAVIDNENKTITITINNSRNTNNGWLAGDKIPLGTVNYGNGSFVTGAQNYNSKSVVAGNDLTVNRGNFSLVVGNALYNAANDAIVGGYLNDNRGVNSIVSGKSNKNLAERSFLIGNENKNATAATDSVVFGVKNENTKTNSFVFGAQNKNEGASSFIGGGANTNTAINSFVYGTQCNNTGMMNVLFGLGHDSSQGGGYLFACGYHSDITGNTLFAVGNGQENNKKNAFEVSKDGSIYLRSPNGTKYKLAVDDSGTLTVTPAT